MFTDSKNEVRRGGSLGLIEFFSYCWELPDIPISLIESYNVILTQTSEDQSFSTVHQILRHMLTEVLRLPKSHGLLQQLQTIQALYLTSLTSESNLAIYFPLANT